MSLVDGFSCGPTISPYSASVTVFPRSNTRIQLPKDHEAWSSPGCAKQQSAQRVSAPRVASDGGPLPSARQVSVTVHRPLYQDDPAFTVMLAVWGQFLDHDITATALSQVLSGSSWTSEGLRCVTGPLYFPAAEGGKAISCCQKQAAPKQHPECFPVSLGSGDPYYTQWNVSCMEFVRSAPAPTCHFGPREQLNQATNYIDGSVVYGSNVTRTNKLRSFQGGELRMLETVDGRSLLPMSTDPTDGCNQEVENAKGRYCFDTDNKNGFQKCSFYHEQPIVYVGPQTGPYRTLRTRWTDLRLASHIDSPIINTTVKSQLRDAMTKGRGKREIPEKTCRPTASSCTIPTCENPVARLGIEPGSPWWEASVLIAQPLWPRDPRANENLHLTTMHLLWARQHNQLARRLAAINPSWNDERLFQEARKILSAQMQHITYNEFLPTLLGNDLMTKLRMSPEPVGYFTGYNSSVDPSIANNFATAAFRFAHTLLPGLMKILGNDTKSQAYVELHKMLFNPFSLYVPGQLDSTLRGAMSTMVQKFNPHFTNEVASFPPPEVHLGWGFEALALVIVDGHVCLCPQITEHLFERATAGTVPFPCGLDLVSLNIQRGRDHGLPSYPSWRQHCGFPRPSTFKDLQGIMDPDSVDHITTIYRKDSVDAIVCSARGYGLDYDTRRSVEDVDLYTGALSEYPIEGGVLGPTITCLITDQFVRLKFGDRHWYETSQQPQGFTRGVALSDAADTAFKWKGDSKAPLAEARKQLQEIRKTTLASVICDTADNLERVQPQVMRSLHAGNMPVSCAGDSLPRPNLNLWKEEGGSFIRPGITHVSLGAPLRIPKIINPVIPKNIRIVGSVETASFTTVSGYRSLTFPLAIPVDPFDSVAPPGFVSPAYPPTYGHGVQWDGSLSGLSSTGKLTMRASFSLPKYIHGHGLLNHSVLWLNGGINADIKSTANSSGEFLLPISGVYSSPVYFQEMDEFVNLKILPKPPTIYDLSVGADFTPFPSVSPNPLSSKAPLILTGSYSADRRFFVWSGNVMLVVTLPRLKAEIEETAKEEKKPEANIPLEPHVEPNVDINTLGTVPITGSVTKASMTVGEFTVTPSFPIAIPARPFDDVISIYTVSSVSNILPPMFGKGIAWEGKISSVGPGKSIQATGRFSVPKFTHGPWLGNFSVQWLNGEFSFDFQPQLALFPGALPPVEGTFSSPIYFQERKEFLYLRNESVTSAAVPEKLYTPNPSVNVGPITPKIPICLLGTYSLDKSVFWWTGNVTVQVQYPAIFDNAGNVAGVQESNVDVEVPASLGKLKSMKKPVYVTVKSGTVQASLLNSKSPDFTWNGKFPVTIPYPFFDRKLVTGLIDNEAFIKFEQGISWSGSVTGNLVSGYTLDGTFSLTRFLHSNITFGFGLQSWSGKFSVEFDSTDPTVTSLINSGVSYSSPVYFKTALFTPIAGEFPARAAGVSGLPVFAPLVLLGDFAVDKSYFLWSGKAILFLPTTPLIGSQIENKEGEDKIVPSQTLDSESTNTHLPTQASLPIIASVVKGTVKSGWSSWSPSFPVAIPAHPFDVISSSLTGNTELNLIPPIYGKGVVWEGKLSTPYSDGIIYANGKFSMPKFVHGVGGFLNFSLEWLNGDFDFQFKPLLNLFSPTIPAIEGIFSSPVNLQERKEFLYLTNLTTPVPSIFKGPYDSYPTVKAGPILQKVPVSLIGTYSLDKTVFWWSGNVSISLKYKPFYPFNDIPDIKESPISVKSTKSLITPKIPKTPIAVTVNSGSIEASISNSNKVDFVWDGKFPVDIPYPFFDRKVASTSGETEPTLTVGRGIMWSGMITKSSLSEETLHGTFSFSRFVHNSLSYSFGLESWSGKFSLDLSISNNISVGSLIGANILYSSPVYFKTIPLTPVFEMTSMEMEDGITGAPSVAPIVLLGTFSPGKTYFSWSGKVIIMLPLSTVTPSLTVKAAKVKDKTKVTPKPDSMESGGGENVPIMGTVVQGTIMVDGGSDWTPNFPVAIPAKPFDTVVREYASETTASILPPIFGNGILWQGQITSPSSDGIVYASGHFSMPKYVHSYGLYNFTLQWLNGDFSFQIQPLFNLIASTMPQIGGSFSSPVYFQERKEYAYMKNMSSPMVMPFSGPYTDSPTVEAGITTQEAPIILLGAFSKDKSVFWWSGSILLQMKYKLATDFNTQNVLNLKLSKAAATAAKGPKSFLNFTVISGSLYASVLNSTEPPFEWDGTLPVTLPNPFFDVVVKSALSVQAAKGAKPAAGGFMKYGQGISWSGELAGNETDGYSIQGTFSFAKFLHGNVTKGFAVEIWSGNFSFDIDDIKSNVSLETLLIPTSKFSSPMVFKPLIVEMATGAGDAGTYPGDYGPGKDKGGNGGKGKDPAKDKSGKAEKSKFGKAAMVAPLTLLGDLSEDKTSFTWGGSVSLQLPATK
ncbi:hypothetical protein PR048_016860 [Dryococelus australis]|uniref:Uncharacterized protein n=1 Tax=Dryococelus australis TaxID=614101 RepID=A0ABQ9H802_9NEOP|nr:hypothetical protein PR048_016860 [Dryococelus australis]